MSEEQEWRQVARWLQQADRGVAFTGAGISTESARLVIIHREPTDQDDRADVVLRGAIGETLRRIEKMALSSG